MEVERRTFGELLRYYRRRKGYSNLERLAEKLGTSKDVLSAYENDKVVPEHGRLLRLISELDMPAVPALRAIGYPIEERAGFDELLAGDPHLDDEGREFILRALLLERSQTTKRQVEDGRSPGSGSRRTRRAS